ncbi:MAG: glycine cleavage T C-terminal barrel domain-containing protein [Isosphaeraceae bacterium]
MSRHAGYWAAARHVALRDQTPRVRLEITGPDRAKFLHNLTTNEVKRLPAGRGCEAFVTSPQGKILAFVNLLIREDAIIVSADPAGLTAALPHFQKYGVFDEIGIEDRGGTTFELHVSGPHSEELIRRCGGPVPEPSSLSHAAGSLADCPVLVWRDSPTGRPGLTVIGPRASAGKVAGLLEAQGRDLGLERAGDEDFEALRIEAGTPVFGLDLTEKNLPQEAGRDETAINFVKGCYLGQETVARIDALGHVNQVLKGLRFPNGETPPAPGTAIDEGGRRVGVVTSSAFSPGWDAPIALAMIRTSHASVGNTLVIGENEATGRNEVVATVTDLPMLPPTQ